MAPRLHCALEHVPGTARLITGPDLALARETVEVPPELGEIAREPVDAR